jgi:hypothetical protein
MTEPSGRMWWTERGEDGAIVHLSLVEVTEAMPKTTAIAHYRVRSVRSGRFYVAADHELLPLARVTDPVERCSTCGKARANHNVRHPFEPAPRWCQDPSCTFDDPRCAKHRERLARALANGMPRSGRWA